MTNVSAGVIALNQDAGVSNFATGTYTGDGTAGDVQVACGFTPRYVKLCDITLGLYYEYIEGMPATTTMLNTGSTGVVTQDANSVIVTNAAQYSYTEMAVGVPGAQAPGEGTTGTVSVIEEAANHTLPNLLFRSGAAGVRANAASSVYLWMAIG